MDNKEKIDEGLQDTPFEGELTIEAENLFPILKKWMYSERDVFLRELVANALDAIKKLQNIINFGDHSGTIEPEITISLDVSRGTLTVSDNGLGMTHDEVERYINQIAFSGVNDFVKRYSDKDVKDQTIGFFGVGFYSSFMVSSRVEIITRSYKEGSGAVKWTCEGTPKFTMERSEREEIGTDVVLYVDEDNKDILKDTYIKNVIGKHCQFLPINIKFQDEVLNVPEPLWKKQPSDITDDEYREFYKKLYNTFQEPYFWIHLNVDYPFNLKGILYFPKLQHEMESPQDQIKIFCNQMFVTDHSKELVPEFLTLLQGAVDSADIPLNISRSMLQRDSTVIKIGRLIVTQVARKLRDIHKKDPEHYQGIWEEINGVIKYGCMRDPKFYEKIKEVLIFRSTSGDYTGLEEYLERNREKNDDLVFYATDETKQRVYLDLIKDNGLEALVMDSVIDPHLIQFLEQKVEKVRFTRVDSDISRFIKDTGIKEGGDKGATQEKNGKEYATIGDIFNKYLGVEELMVEVEELKNDSVPAMLVIEELMRRFEDMSRLTKTTGFPFNSKHVLVVNAGNPTIKNLLRLYRGRKKDRVERMTNICKTVYDLALLAQGKLEDESVANFIERTGQIVEKYSTR